MVILTPNSCRDQNGAVSNNKSTTKGGNSRSPLIDVYLKWIFYAWDQVPKELIIKSFKNYSLTIALDGSEDNLIHCFKPDGPILEGINILKRSRMDNCANVIAEIFEEIDLGENENNGHESDVSIDMFLASQVHAKTRKHVL